MKNSNFFLLAVTAATVVSCGTHPSSYTINGTVSDTTLNGNKVYLTDMASRNVLDSAVIANGKFTLSGYRIDLPDTITSVSYGVGS